MPKYRAVSNPQNKTFFLGAVDNRTFEFNERRGGTSRTVTKPRLFINMMTGAGFEMITDLSDYKMPAKEGWDD